MNTHFESSSFDSPTPSKKPLLKASNLSHSFEYELYKDINIDINEGESIAILGVSGSGKSTLLHNLSTLLKPKTGTISYNDKYLYDRDSKELLDIRRNDFGIIFQQHYLFKGFSVKENLDISSIIADKKIDEDLLKEFGILQNLNQSVADLSGGQQQRVSIARVMMKKPKLIFADELTGNLDRQTASEVMDVMIRYIKDENAGLFLVTHDEMVAQRCDKVYRLTNKRLESVTL